MNRHGILQALAVGAAVLVLVLIAVFNQVKTGGLARHEAEFAAKTLSTSLPLAETLVLGGAKLCAALHVPRPLGVALVLGQVALCAGLFLALLAYWRQCGVPVYTGLLGLSVVAWALALGPQGEGFPIAFTAALLYTALGAWSARVPGWRWVPVCCGLLLLQQDWRLLGLTALWAGVLTGWSRNRLFYVWFMTALLFAGAILARPVLAVWVLIPALAAIGFARWPNSLRDVFAAGTISVSTLCLVGWITPGMATSALVLLVLLPAVLHAVAHADEAQRPVRRWFVLGCGVFMAAYVVHHQVAVMDFQGGLAWYEKVQWQRTWQVMHGEQGTPWQYRLFTDSIVYGSVRAFEALGIPRPIGTAFVLIRLFQHTLMDCLAVAFFRRLGIPALTSLFGLWLFACGMGHGLYDTDMTFNTYTDLSLFLLAGILILDNRIRWVIPLMFIAALNRETSGCIPVMLLFAWWQWGKRPPAPREVLLVVLAGLVVWLCVVGGLRLVFGLRPYIVPTAGKKPILPLLMFNLTWWRTWVFLAATLGILPFMALASWRTWPETLRRFFWAVVPVWFPAHFCLAHAPETRLFLVPQLLVFLPGALLGIEHWKSRMRR